MVLVVVLCVVVVTVLVTEVMVAVDVVDVTVVDVAVVVEVCVVLEVVMHVPHKTVHVSAKLALGKITPKFPPTASGSRHKVGTSTNGTSAHST